jgi:hypothetical protein
MSTIGKFIATNVQYEGSYGVRSVTITLDSTGPINVSELRELLGTTLELRRTPKGFSAYGKTAPNA